jgi:hypothetical protein
MRSMVTQRSWKVAQMVRTMVKGSLLRVAQRAGESILHVVSVSEDGWGIISRSVVE